MQQRDVPYSREYQMASREIRSRQQKTHNKGPSSQEPAAALQGQKKYTIYVNRGSNQNEIHGSPPQSSGAYKPSGGKRSQFLQQVNSGHNSGPREIINPPTKRVA